MKNTIFWSWQSDLCEKTNRNFIRECLAAAIKQVNEDLDIDDADRFELDHDTKKRLVWLISYRRL